MRLAILFPLLAASLLRADDTPQRLRLTVERQQGAAWKSVNSALVFEQGDKLRFRLSSSFAGYLYVMNHGTSGGYELLFPRADTGSDNRIEAKKDYIVPASQGFFKVSGPAGHDVIYWVVSPVELSRESKPLPPPPSTPDLPAEFRPRCDDTIFKSRGECIDDTAGIKPLSKDGKLPSNLSGVAGAKPRELLFIQEKSATVLSSPASLTGPLLYELHLAHR